jgi:menaquinol-cytochrome c reductase iron-sulfur subunit
MMEQTPQTPGAGTNRDVIVITRRSFFASLLGIGGAAMGALLAIPVLRYVLYPLYAKGAGIKWSRVAPLDSIAAGAPPERKTVTFVQSDGWREVVTSQSVYVDRKEDGTVRVLSSICPHLGCTVSRQSARNEFVCPCHGGVFARDGKRLGGPPPRGMDELPSEISGGELNVQFEYFRPNVPNKELLS